MTFDKSAILDLAKQMHIRPIASAIDGDWINLERLAQACFKAGLEAGRKQKEPDPSKVKPQ